MASWECVTQPTLPPSFLRCGGAPFCDSTVLWSDTLTGACLTMLLVIAWDLGILPRAVDLGLGGDAVFCL